MLILFILSAVFFACSIDAVSENEERETDSRTAQESTNEASSSSFQKTVYVQLENAVPVLYTLNDNSYIAHENLSSDEKQSLSAQNIIISDNIGGIPVSEIADGAFSQLSLVKIISIPASVKKIGDDTFLDCSSLTDIYFGKTETDLFALNGGISFFNQIEALNTNVQWHYESLGPKAESLSELDFEEDNASITVRWKYKTEEKPRLVRLFLEAEGENAKTVEVSDYETLSYTFSDLENGKLYKISATAVNEFGVEAEPIEAFAVPKMSEKIFTADENEFEFLKNSNDNSYTIIGYHGFQDKIEIPSQFNSLPVSAIAQNSFSGSEKNIVSIKIPETVSEISKNVFSDFNNLKSAFFAGSENSITIESGNKNLVNVLWYNTVSVANSKFNAIIAHRAGEKSFTILEYETADEFVNLGELAENYAVSTIASQAFLKSPNVKYIAIPSQIKFVKRGAFSVCSKLEALWAENENISVEAADNTKVSEILEVVSSLSTISQSSDGFITDNSTLLKYVGTDNNVKIPEGISRIAKNAFKENQTIDSVQFGAGAKLTIGSSAFYGSSLRKIIISDQLKSISIGTYAFAECKNLCVSAKYNSSNENFILPTSVIKIGDGAFSGCSSLVSVRFETVGWPVPTQTLSELPNRCFENCISLEKMYLGSQISVLKNYVFKGCTNLSEIKNESTLSFSDKTNAGIRRKLQ